MKRFFPYIILVPCVLWAMPGFSQKKEDLERQRLKLIQEIELTSQQLNQNKKDARLALNDLQLINTQLQKRKDLLHVLEKETQLLGRQQSVLADSLSAITHAIEKQEAEYALILNKAHISARMKHPFQEMLEGAGIYESFKKWIYLGQLKNYVLHKWNLLEESYQFITQKREALRENQKAQEKNIAKVKEEQAGIGQRRREKDDLLKSLQKNTSKLERDLDRKNDERKNLNAQIEKLILAELSRKKSQSAANAKVDLALSKDFTKNRGKLPWPVSQGVITGQFGRRVHPDLKGVYTDNSGVDFLAEVGGPVRAVFSGSVVSVTTIPGHLYMVIVSHGQYFTVYSKMQEARVKVGQNIDIGTPLGILGPSRDGTGNFHFEIWEGKEKKNPQLWLSN